MFERVLPVPRVAVPVPRVVVLVLRVVVPVPRVAVPVLRVVVALGLSVDGASAASLLPVRVLDEVARVLVRVGVVPEVRLEPEVEVPAVVPVPRLLLVPVELVLRPDDEPVALPVLRLEVEPEAVPVLRPEVEPAAVPVLRLLVEPVASPVPRLLVALPVRVPLEAGLLWAPVVTRPDEPVRPSALGAVITGRSYPGVQVLLGRGAGVLGWRM